MLVVGRRCRAVRPGSAADFVAGYTCGNDVTARDLQKVDGQWTRAKSFDTFCPLGPWVVRRAAARRRRRHGGARRRRGAAGPGRRHDRLAARAAVVRVGHHDARARRRDHDRHAAGRRAGVRRPGRDHRGRGRRAALQLRGRRDARPANGGRARRRDDSCSTGCGRSRRRGAELGERRRRPMPGGRAPPCGAAGGGVRRVAPGALDRGAADVSFAASRSCAAPAQVVGHARRRRDPGVALKGPAMAARYWGDSARASNRATSMSSSRRGNFAAAGCASGQRRSPRAPVYPAWYLKRWLYQRCFVAADRSLPTIELHWRFCGRIWVVRAARRYDRSTVPSSVDCCTRIPAGTRPAWQLLCRLCPCGVPRFRLAGAARCCLHRPRA